MLHEPGHHGVKATKNRIKPLFFWPTLGRDVENFVKNCEICDEHRAPPVKPKTPLGELPVEGPFELVFLDLVGGQGSLSTGDTGPKTILSMIDSLTGWAEAVPIPDQTAKTVAETFFSVWISRFGVPYRIHTDQGPQFESSLLARLCEILRIRHSRTTPYRPQANGKVERFNRTFVAMLRKAVGDHPEDWEEFLPAILMAYRSTISNSTGYTPYKLAFGREMRLGIDYGEEFPDPPSTFEDYANTLAKNLCDSYKIARETLGNRHKKAKENYDKNSFENFFKVGDLVRTKINTKLVGKATKFSPEWSGLKEIREVRGPLLRVADLRSGETRVVHHDSVRKSSFPVPPRELLEETFLENDDFPENGGFATPFSQVEMSQREESLETGDISPDKLALKPIELGKSPDRKLRRGTRPRIPAFKSDFLYCISSSVDCEMEKKNLKPGNGEKGDKRRREDDELLRRRH